MFCVQASEVYVSTLKSFFSNFVIMHLFQNNICMIFLSIQNNIIYTYTSLSGIVIQLIFKNIYPWDINFSQHQRASTFFSNAKPWDKNFFIYHQ